MLVHSFMLAATHHPGHNIMLQTQWKRQANTGGQEDEMAQFLPFSKYLAASYAILSLSIAILRPASLGASVFPV